MDPDQFEHGQGSAGDATPTQDEVYDEGEDGHSAAQMYDDQFGYFSNTAQEEFLPGDPQMMYNPSDLNVDYMSEQPQSPTNDFMNYANQLPLQEDGAVVDYSEGPNFQDNGDINYMDNPQSPENLNLMQDLNGPESPDNSDLINFLQPQSPGFPGPHMDSPLRNDSAPNSPDDAPVSPKDSAVTSGDSQPESPIHYEDQPASPIQEYFEHASQDVPASPGGSDSALLSPAAGDISYEEESSQNGSQPESPARSVSPPVSPTGLGSPMTRTEDGPLSPDESGSPSGSRSVSQSPIGSLSASHSPVGVIQSPIGSISAPQSPAASDGSQSPVGNTSYPQSPDASDGPQSPVGNTLYPQSPAASDGPQSPVGNTSYPQSPAASDGPQSPVEHASPPASPADSDSFMGSPRNSPTGSLDSGGHRSRRSRSGSRSRTGSNVSMRSGSRSRSGSNVSMRSGSRSGSASPSGSRVSLRSGSRGSLAGSLSPRSRSVSPASRGSGSPRSRSASPPGSPRSRSVSPVGSVNEGPGRETELGSDLQRSKEKGKDSDDEGSEKGSAVGELIADIFGESDDEEEEFEGFGAADVEAHARKEKATPAVLSDDEAAPAEGEILPTLSSDDEGEDSVRKDRDDFVSDFELMLQKKKEEMRRKRRKRKDGDIINDNDDLIAAMIQNMKQSAEEDRDLNNAKKPAVMKLKSLPNIMTQLRKSDLHEALLECNVLSAITEWLAPLPDKSLPHLQIREALLRQLIEFPPINTELLKSSGVGKAVMYLYKHPRESRDNKVKAGKLINEWSRPIFNLTSNYKSLTREEREQRDYEQLPKKRKLTLDGSQTPRRDIDKALQGEEQALRPGDPGYVMRARVPQPSKKDYVIRPKWAIEEKPSRGTGKKPLNRYEKHLKDHQDSKRNRKSQKAVAISIEGRNMAL